MRYKNILQDSINSISNLEVLKETKILIVGASGLIGRFTVDLLMELNNSLDYNIAIYAVSRNKEYGESIFGNYLENKNFKYISHDVTKEFDLEVSFDYIINAASNTHPLSYSKDPIGTIMTNVVGFENVLKLATKSSPKKIVCLSSVEVYGKNVDGTEIFNEDYCGYIDCNTLRAGYPESKRCAEALSQAYIAQKGLDISIARLTRCYGPTMKLDDSKAMSQFLKKGLNKEDIVLKSKGEQIFSYCFVADAVSGIFTVLLKGKNGEAYNISDNNSIIKLKDLAEYIATLSDTKVIFELPSNVESKGYSTAKEAVLGVDKILTLGWRACVDIKSGVKATLEILEKNNKLSKRNI